MKRRSPPRDEINEHTRAWREKYPSSRLLPKVVCRDSFEMSVQASDIHYSLPKTMTDEYHLWEVGFPSKYEVLLGSPNNDIFSFVDTGTVNSIIRKHGGME